MHVNVVDRLPRLGARAACAEHGCRDALLDHEACIQRDGEDAPAIRDSKRGGSGRSA